MSLRFAVVAVASLPLIISAASETRDACEAPPALMRRFGITYKEALRQAYAHKEPALTVLFRLATSSELDGMWAQCYTSDIRRLLDVWGDKQFATVLHKQPPFVQKAVWQILREIAYTELANRYPESFRVIHP